MPLLESNLADIKFTCEIFVGFRAIQDHHNPIFVGSRPTGSAPMVKRLRRHARCVGIAKWNVGSPKSVKYTSCYSNMTTDRRQNAECECALKLALHVVYCRSSTSIHLHSLLVAWQIHQPHKYNETTPTFWPLSSALSTIPRSPAFSMFLMISPVLLAIL